jgi:hypothetical protein
MVKISYELYYAVIVYVLDSEKSLYPMCYSVV